MSLSFFPLLPPSFQSLTFLPSILRKPHPLPHRTIRHIRLPLRAYPRILRQITIRRKALREIELDSRLSIVFSARHPIQRGDNEVRADVVDEDEVHGRRHRPVERERRVGLHVVGLIVIRQVVVQGVVAVVAKVVGGVVAWRDGGALAADDASCRASRQLGLGMRVWIAALLRVLQARELEAQIQGVHLALLVPALVEDVEHFARERVRHVAQELEAVLERAYDEGVIEGEWPLHQVEADVAGVREDQARHVRTLRVDHRRCHGFLHQGEDVARREIGLARLAPRLRRAAVEVREIQGLARVGDYFGYGKSLLEVEGLVLRVLGVDGEGEAIPIEVATGKAVRTAGWSWRHAW